MEEQMKVKKLIALLAVSSMVMGLVTGCGNTESSQTQGAVAEETVEAVEEATEEVAAEETAQESTEVSADLSGTEISFLNSKGEIQAALEEMSAAFEEETGISVEIIACGAGESPYPKITSSYNSGTAPTMTMLDTTDIVALEEEYALVLTGEIWVGECENQVTKINDNVDSLPFCVEGRGLV